MQIFQDEFLINILYDISWTRSIFENFYNPWIQKLLFIYYSLKTVYLLFSK